MAVIRITHIPFIKIETANTKLQCGTDVQCHRKIKVENYFIQNTSRYLYEIYEKYKIMHYIMHISNK